jgi:hypothetical protein
MHGRQLRFTSIIIALMCSITFGSGAVAGGKAQQRMIELTLPRPATSEEAVWVQIRARMLPRGTEIRVSTPDGTLLGTVSPYGAPAHDPPDATYTIPLPENVIVDDRVQLRLEVDEPGKPARPPRPVEVESVHLIYLPITN